MSDQNQAAKQGTVSNSELIETLDQTRRIGTSRIFVDVRGADGHQIADQLSLLGFLVQPFYPVRLNKHKYESFLNKQDWLGQKGTILHAVFPSDSQVFANSHQSVKEKSSRPVCGEVARMWKSWQLCPQCCQDDKNDIRNSCL